MSNRNGRRVISIKNLQMRMPLWPSLVAWLVLDRLNAPGWVDGVVGCFFAFAWGVWISDVLSCQSVDVLNNRKPPEE